MSDAHFPVAEERRMSGEKEKSGTVEGEEELPPWWVGVEDVVVVVEGGSRV